MKTCTGNITIRVNYYFINSIREPRAAGFNFSQSNLGSIMSLFGLIFCLQMSVIRPGLTNHGQPVLNLEHENFFFLFAYWARVARDEF